MGVNRDKTQKSFLTLNFSSLIDSFVFFSIQVEEVDCMCENDGFAHVIPEIWNLRIPKSKFPPMVPKKRCGQNFISPSGSIGGNELEMHRDLAKCVLQVWLKGKFG